MASKKNTPDTKTSAAKADDAPVTKTEVALQAQDEAAPKNDADANRKAAAKRVQAKAGDVEHPSGLAEDTAAIEAGIAAQREEVVDSESHASRVQQALADRQRDVKEMAKEYDGRRRERDRRATKADKDEPEMATAAVVPVEPGEGEVPAGMAVDVRIRGGAPLAASQRPGTGVADPKDLAPGQSLAPSPPGGVAIRPLPDKPGTNYSKLK